MFPTITIDDTRGQQVLNDLHDALIGAGQMGDAATILQDEFRLWLKMIINLTPPPGLGRDAQAKGEGAIKRDLAQLFTPIDEDMLNHIGSIFGVSGIDHWITDRDGKHKHLIWDRLDPSGEGMESFHRANQDRRGRTRKLKRNGRRAGVWYAPYVVSKRDFGPYLIAILSHVGLRKAGWAQAYIDVGGRVQGWIKRHLPTRHGRVDNRLDLPNPSISATNSSPGIADDERIVRDSKRARVESMTKRLKLVLSGYSKQVARGIRPTRQVQPTPSDE